MPSYPNYHPVFLDLNGRAALIVGGGSVAMEKLHSLIPSGAKIHVVSPEATPEIKAWAADGALVWLERPFMDEDVLDAFLVVAATDDPTLNARVFRVAEENRRLANSVDDPVNCNFIMAAITRSGPMQVAVSSAGCSPALAQRLRNRIKADLLSDELGGLAELLGSWRRVVKEALPTYKDRQAFWEFILDSDVPAILESQGREAASAEIESLLEAGFRVPGSGCREPEPENLLSVARGYDRSVEPGPRSGEPGLRNPEPGTRNPEPGTRPAAPGRVVLIGAGPGDPDLITVKGVKALNQADVVLYDRLANPELLSHAPAQAVLIDVGKAPGDKGQPRQETIHALMIEHARRGRTVVRLKGGDPFVFGRGGEEVIALREAGIECEVVPGISSAIAAPSSAGIPVTHRGLSTGFAVFTAQGAGPNDTVPWEHAAHIPTLVLLMGVERLPAIVENLLAQCRSPDTPIAVISRATTNAQRTAVGTLETIVAKAADLPSPATIVVGEVVRVPLECAEDPRFKLSAEPSARIA